MASFECDSFLAAAETAIEEAQQAELHAQDLVSKREADLQAVQEALQKATERLQELQSRKDEKTQEKARLQSEKDAKQATLQEAGEERTRAEEQLQEAELQVENAKKSLLEAQKDLEQKLGLEQGFAVKKRTFQTFAMEAEQIERTTNQELLNSEERSTKAKEALQKAEEMLSEQNQESKRLEVKLREETNKGDTKAAMDAAAIAAARALLEIVPFKDPSLTVPKHTEAPDIYSDAYNGHRTDESRQREMAEAAPKKELHEEQRPSSPDVEEAPEAKGSEVTEGETKEE